jgi:hypothetical protein
MSERTARQALMQRYFRGIHEGDVEALREVFHRDARIEDAYAGGLRSRSVEQYLSAVASRQSPNAAGEPLRMQVLSIEAHAGIATVGAELRFLGGHYYNALSLLDCDGRWRIVHKLFAAANEAS